MTVEKVKLDGGKYEIVVADHGAKFYANRHGEYWQSLTGNSLVMACFYRIQELQNRVSDLEDALEQMNEMEE